jgi:hypothetical protein
VITLGVVLALAIAFIPPLTPPRVPKVLVCHNHLTQIALALIHYDNQHGFFPPVGTAGRDGKPVPSWRVAILPYLGRRDLYEQYDLKESWQSPKNQAVAAAMPAEYRCPSDPESNRMSQQTSYVMIAAGGIGELDDKTRRLDWISPNGGTAAETILVIEVPGSGVRWTEPRDLSIDEVIARLRRKDRGGHVGVLLMAFCDGHVEVLPQDTGWEALLRALANPHHKKPVNRHEK